MLKKILLSSVLFMGAFGAAFASEIPDQYRNAADPTAYIVMRAFEDAGKPYWWAFPTADFAAAAVMNRDVCGNINANNEKLIEITYNGFISHKLFNMSMSDYEHSISSYMSYKASKTPGPENTEFYCKKLNVDVDNAIYELTLAAKAKGKTLETYFD